MAHSLCHLWSLYKFIMVVVGLPCVISARMWTDFRVRVSGQE